MLSRVTEWYNYIRKETVNCEFELISKEIDEFDVVLADAFGTITWENYEQTYIEKLYNILKDLYRRVQKTKSNVDNIKESIRSWGTIPLYERKDGAKTTLLNLDDRSTKIPKRMQDCAATKNYIEQVMDENFRLFFKLPIKSEEESVTEDEVEQEQVEEFDADLDTEKKYDFG
jgi:dynein heavy chain, axonemal